MASEEERRWREYEEEALLAPGGGGEAAVEVEVPQNEAEMMEALEWMKEARSMQLKERNSEHSFDFCLAHVAEGQEEGPLAFRLEWREPGQQQCEGFVDVADVDEVKISLADPAVFSLVLRAHNPKAVNNSGGLHAVNVRAESASECAMYRSGLLGLMSIAGQ